MATTLFLLSTAPDTHRGTNTAKLDTTTSGWTPLALGTARGSGLATLTSSTVTGATNGVEMAAAGIPIEWISPPVSADVTIAGTITVNIWAEENNMSANVAINGVVDVIRANATGTGNSNTLVEIGRSARVAEVVVGTGVRTVNNFTFTPTSTVVNRGDRLRVRIFGDDVGTMASGFTFDIGFNGTTGAADGDTFVTFTETITFESAPAGTQLFLTNVQSGLSGAPALISDFTGADENPLSEGGNWAALAPASGMQRVSNTAGGTVAGSSHSYWTPANFGPDLDIYATFSTASGAIGIWGRLKDETGSFTWDGYRVFASAAGSSLEIDRVDNGTITALITSASITWSAGDKVGMRIEGSTIQAWRQASGGSWNLVLTIVDATYAAAGKIAISGSGTACRLDDLYAATNSNLFTQQAWTSRGAGVVSYLSDTEAGWVAPLYTQEWYTRQLTAFTLTGLAQANIRALESSTSANASLRMEIARVDADGTNPTVWSTWCIAPTGTNDGALTASEVARTANLSGDDLAVSDGQRLRFRLYLEDVASAAMANAFNVQPFYNGTSAAASGDSYVTLAQSVTEFVASAGSDPTSWISERRTPRRRSMQRW